MFIIKKYLKHQVIESQNKNNEYDENNKYYKIYDLTLKDTTDEDNVQCGFGCKNVNKYVQVHKQSILYELNSTTATQVTATCLGCSLLFGLLILTIAV